jgi:hypothetical protein
VQWGLTYVAGAWLLLQVVGFAADTFDWPRQIQQFASIGLALRPAYWTGPSRIGTAGRSNRGARLTCHSRG